MVFTFWEGVMPEYIRLCLKTWKIQYIILNYDNLHNYTDISIDKIKKFSLPQIADCVRVHVLRDWGGYWLDADTIMINDKLPEEMVIGDPNTRTNTCGYLHTEPHSEMFEKWAEFQDEIINDEHNSTHWSVLANDFSDPYLQEHPDIQICPVWKCWPETHMINGDISRYNKYQMFYFNNSFTINDIEQTNMLMLHNSWTPEWYKLISKSELLNNECTLSNILRELI